MSKGKNLFQINLLGTSFTIKSDEDPEYLSRTVEYLSKKIKQIELSSITKDPLRTSILSGILLVDELFKNKERFSSEIIKKSNEAEEITIKMIDCIDSSLDNI